MRGVVLASRLDLVVANMRHMRNAVVTEKIGRDLRWRTPNLDLRQTPEQTSPRRMEPKTAHLECPLRLWFVLSVLR